MLLFHIHRLIIRTIIVHNKNRSLNKTLPPPPFFFQMSSKLVRSHLASTDSDGVVDVLVDVVLPPLTVLADYTTALADGDSRTTHGVLSDDAVIKPHSFLRPVPADTPPEKSGTYIMRSSLGDERPSGRIVGASLLCFCVDPCMSRLYFLLCKERKNVGWRDGSEKWSDFGGKVSAEASTAEDTAAKEFMEESLSMVQYFKNDNIPRTQYRDIADSLRRGEYAFQIKVLFGTAEEPRNHVTFVKQIPWDPSALLRFDECRTMLLAPSLFAHTSRWAAHVTPNEHIFKRGSKSATTPSELSGYTKMGGSRSRAQKYKKVEERRCEFKVKDDCMEKKCLGLWSIPQLQKAVETNGFLFKNNRQVEQCKSSFTSIIELVLSELAFVRPEIIDETSYNNIKHRSFTTTL